MSKSIGATSSLKKPIAEREDFWAEKLANLQPLTIPYAKQGRSKHQDFTEIITPVNDELTTLLCRSFPDCLETDILFTAFMSYMARISSTACFDIGFTDVELTQEIVNLEGLFTAYIPCRMEIDLEQDFRQIWQSVRSQLKFAKQHQGYALDLATREPILNSLPGLDSEKILPVAVERASSLEDSRGNQPFGSNFTFTIPDDAQECRWQFDPEILNRDHISRMWTQFETLLHSIVQNPEQSLAEQSLLPPEERDKILWDWNQAKVHPTEDKCIQQLFEEQVELNPDAIAVTYQEQQLTYRELNNRANQLAQHLRSLGVAPEVLVGFCVERSLEMIIGLLGIIKAGGAYVPLDPTYPPERLAYMVADAKISVLLTQQKLVPQLPEHEAQVVYLDSDWDQIAVHSQENLAVANTDEQLAYIIYTSGSTGKPKGVMITHLALSRFAQTIKAEYGIVASDRILQFASINFDVAVEEIYTCLLAGSTLVLRTDEMLTNIQTFFQACQRLQLTVLNLPTAYWHQLVGELRDTQVNFPESVRLVIIGGEKVLPEPVKSWQEYVVRTGKSDRLQLINSYGPTETTVTATTYPIPANTSSIEGEVPIGRPLSHLQAYILDPYQQPVPIGVPGELYIGGDGLARGYLNRSQLTAEKFISNFFRPESAARLYKTGDLVRYLPDGNIEYIGRIDKQVKIRGFRIELGEIETVVAQYPGIRQTAVVAREDTPGDKRLVAYFVPHQGQFSLRELRSFLRERLPNYMIPAAFVPLDSLPITPSGKIDHRGLPVPDFSRSELSETFVAPQNDLELKLTKIWEEILKIKPISVTDNFFDLGGHSLLAVGLLTHIEKTFQKNITLGTFLTVPTIRELGSVISQADSSISESLIFEIRATGSKPPLFLINAMGTGMLAYKLLAKYLDPEQPVYGIRAVGMDDDRLPHNRIGQMAEAYIREMRTIQAEGPYFIAGVCTGGTVAFEMACQLNSQGSEVAFLGLIDSTARPILFEDGINAASKDVNNTSSSPTLFERYIKHNFVLRGLNNLLGVLTNPRLKLGDKLSFTADMMGQLGEKTRHKLEIIAYKTRKNQRLPYQLRRSLVFDAGEEALRHFTPQTYPGGKAILIRASDNPEHVDHNYQLGWDEFVTEELEVYEVPGDQTTLLFEPNIRFLAEKISSCLNDVHDNY